MSIQKVPTEVNAFVKGLITEASPLTFPENASLDEQNFILNRDGSRQRRLGMDLQGTNRLLGAIGLEGKSTSTYHWEEAGGVEDNTFIVCQVGLDLLFYATLVGQEVPEYHSTINMGDFVSFGTENIPQVDMSSIDGVLIVAHGEGDILSIRYDDSTSSFIATTFRLKIRDTFGIQVPYERVYREVTAADGTVKTYPYRLIDDMLDDEALNLRPFRQDVPNLHMYNLRNQSWGRVRESVRIVSGGSSDSVGEKDPIQEFDDTTGFYPSNADIVNTGLISYAELTGAPTRFVAKELGLSPESSSSAPRGFFVIDALRRGYSRKQQYDLMFGEAAGDLTFNLVDPLIADSTLGGAKCVEEFAGRAWYGGFSGDTFYPDSRSPSMGSFILFSQLVKNQKDLNKCYQKNDPTFEKEADLLATDGGFVRLDGAYGIKRFATIGNSLFIFATNGIWAISGGTDEGFSAEAYIVRKVSDKGILAPKSVVVVDSSCMFWGEDGIYVVAETEVGGYKSQNISNTTIQKKYESIPIDQRRAAYGIYDSYENTVRWVYGVKAVGNPSYELVLNLDLNAYAVSVINPASATSPVLLAPVTVPPFKAGELPAEVYVGADRVLSNLDEVSINEKSSIAASRETYYFTLTAENRVSVGFATYTDEQFIDWKTTNGIGVDAEAFLVTGYGPQGDFQRRKQASRITTYMTKTEDSFELVGTDLVPANQSSCLLQARWDWHNSPSGNRWGRENQIYKNKRLYMPEDISDTYDDGESVITTKTKLRGHGKTLSLLFKSEPEKDCKLLGWSMVTDVSTNV